MKKFDLESLPLCGAITRSGSPCKRKGSLRNGRCKLHGGRATGPKTEEGKLISSKNAVKVFPFHLFTPTPKENIIQIQKATIVHNQLYDAAYQEKKPNLEKMAQIAKTNRICLESTKYYICRERPDAFLLIQSALDLLYQTDTNTHLAFHIHKGMFMLPEFQEFITPAKRKYLDEWRKKHPFEL